MLHEQSTGFHQIIQSLADSNKINICWKTFWIEKNIYLDIIRYFSYEVVICVDSKRYKIVKRQTKIKSIYD